MKFSNYFIFTILIGIVIFLGCKVTPIDDEDVITDFQIRNETDSVFVLIRIREDGYTYWQQTIYTKISEGLNTIKPNIFLNAQLKYDLQLEMAAPEKHKVTLSRIGLDISGSIVDVKITDFDDPKIANQVSKIKIFNNTKVNFSSVNIRAVGASSWIPVTGNFPSESDPQTIILPRILDTTARYDVWLRESSGITAQKNNIQLIHNGTILFVNEDIK